MQYDEFIKHVQSYTQADSRETAEKAVVATLETLKERIVGDEASQLAAQLPEPLAKHLRGREGEFGDHFNLEEFYSRVSQKEGVDPSTAVIHVKGVFSVLNAAVTPGEFQDVKANFSKDYDELFAPSGN
ncbi:MAG: DUF2267 domain-containing protein [Myxacorys chilensis ATA2-1-KO14]|jgi:uncharacterized protein (DUF2267 family)|nr:DUF2267 domain-containing protein [Myxacorys chilensis ATA2-1-KO14]